MNFTREPIIETVITPKEGFRLVLRNINGISEKEYSVESIEVVSLGGAFFFRSMEAAQAFLLPVSDYEVLETRELQTVLKKPKIEKSIKIGGGSNEKRSKVAPENQGEKASEERSRKKAPRRRPSPVKKEHLEEMESKQSELRALLSPPTSLISEHIDRYKECLAVEENFPSEEFTNETDDAGLKETHKGSLTETEIEKEERSVDIKDKAPTIPQAED